ncbi:MAG: hypothetical protein JSV34_04610 [Candidatus Omnitrophota bacterium]|nr:MAG: hypothetical protein JSV34_04610 [Candidatus Omnitrophota bacterium]
MIFNQSVFKTARKIVLVSGILFFLSGCVPMLVGGAGVLAGYTLGNDSAVGNVKEEYRILWDLCMDKLESMDAEIHIANESKGIIKALIAENSVAIKIDTLNPKTQKLKISARKYLLPKVQFAQKVFFKVVEDFE